MNITELYEELRDLGPAPTGSDAALYRREILLSEMGALTGSDPQEEAVTLPGSRAAISAGMAFMLLMEASVIAFFPPVGLMFGAVIALMIWLHIDGRMGFWLAMGARKIASNSSITKRGGRPLLIIHASLSYWPVGGRFTRLLHQLLSQDHLKRVLLLATMFVALVMPLMAVMPNASVFVSAIGGLFLLLWMSMAVVQADVSRAVAGAELTGPIAALKLAQMLWARDDLDCEIRLIISEGDQSALIGLRSYLDRHMDDMAGRPVTCISLDNIGAGYPTLITSAGIVQSKDLRGRLFKALSGQALAADLSGLGLVPGRLEQRDVHLSDVAALAAARLGMDTALIMGQDGKGQRAGRHDWQLSGDQIKRQINSLVPVLVETLVARYQRD